MTNRRSSAVPSARTAGRIHVLQHEPHEGPAAAGSVLLDLGAELTYTRFHDGRPDLPPVPSVDGLLIMGGSMNADEHSAYPWLSKEKDFIGRVIAAGKPVLGICLGAQIIARVLGAAVTRNIHREIGWFPVRRTVETQKNPLYDAFPDFFTAFHWHGDTFDIPPGAVRTFENDCTLNQGFHYGAKVCALQFHLESRPAEIMAFVEQERKTWTKGPFVQDPDDIIGASAFSRTQPLLHSLVSGLFSAP
jgi:GMP synthase (glutamine-hydrolysing)